MTTIKPPKLKYSASVYAFSGLGAIGVALQNYPAVVLFASGLAAGVIPASNWLGWSIHIAALATGGLCSGMVNFWMNAELLDGFFKRMTSKKEALHKQLTAWQKFLYFSGLFVFVVTGILFGLMAFVFAMEGPLAIISIVAGVFVAGIMTIQEVETWLQEVETWPSSYDDKESKVEKPLTKHQLCGKSVGHMVAAGNVLALSLLFTLGLAQGLMLLNVAALPALIAGFAVAFTFGAFTEYFFYNFYLANFCKNFGDNLTLMMNAPQAKFGFLCVSINALVNGALTYAGVVLLTGLLFAASLPLPPLMLMTTLAAVSAVFAGSASFILGMDFWIRQSPVKADVAPLNKEISIAKSPLGLFATTVKNQQAAKNENMVDRKIEQGKGVSQTGGAALIKNHVWTTSPQEENLETLVSNQLRA
jgi:hypothetical protein